MFLFLFSFLFLAADRRLLVGMCVRAIHDAEVRKAKPKAKKRTRLKAAPLQAPPHRETQDGCARPHRSHRLSLTHLSGRPVRRETAGDRRMQPALPALL